MNYLKFSALVLLVFAIDAYGTQAERTFVHSKVWKSKLEKNLPPEMCQSKGFFRHCYSVSESECKSLAETHTRKCLNGFKVPPKVATYGNGVTLAYRLGMCVGDKMNFSLSDRKTNKERCNNVYEWR